jgi:hypothetical protein
MSRWPGERHQCQDRLARINLSELQTELDVINKSVDEGLERLSHSDLDLTSKVSETTVVPLN